VTPVNVYQGTYVSFTSPSAVWSGIYQDAPCEPGQIFTGDLWVYNADPGDPIPVGNLKCYLEVQFRNAADQVIVQHISPIFSNDIPASTWTKISATLGGDYTQIGAPKPPDGKYLIAPAGTTKARFQMTLNDVDNVLSGAGSLYYDSASLLLKRPATLAVTQAGANVQLSWETLAATSYQVQFKGDAGGSWTNLEVVPGTGSTVTRSYPSSEAGRLYRVLTL
jgi:hypothetical protein